MCPLYDYRCSTCGHSTEKLESVTASQKQECPKCRNNSLLRQIAPSSFILAGNSWCKDGYK